MPVQIKKGGGANTSLAVLKGLQKMHGEHVGLMGIGYAPVGRVPTGIFPMDLAIGGGFPIWRIGMVFGKESSGKTAILLNLLGMVQRFLKRRAVLVDAEHVYDNKWTENFKVDTKDLIVVQPDNAEQSVDACEGFMNADDVGIVVLDSLAAIQPQKWIEAEAGKANVGGNTQIISSLYTKVGAAITRQHKAGNPILFVVSNQIRNKVGVMYGDPEITPGGHQPRFASSMSVHTYGKKVFDKDINKDMPLYLDVSGAVRKWRVPIVGTAFEYKMCLTPHKDYEVGDIMGTWDTVSNRLQASGDLKKKGKGWVCVEEEAATLDMLEEKYLSDLDWQLLLQQKVMNTAVLQQ